MCPSHHPLCPTLLNSQLPSLCLSAALGSPLPALLNTLCCHPCVPVRPWAPLCRWWWLCGRWADPCPCPVNTGLLPVRWGRFGQKTGLQLLPPSLGCIPASGLPFSAGPALNQHRECGFVLSVGALPSGVHLCGDSHLEGSREMPSCLLLQ